MSSRKKWAAFAAGAAAVCAGGTFAYFNQSLTAANVFDTGTYDTELIEEFRPGDGENWEPGSEVNKDVTVQNLGSLPVVARVKFQEKWERKDTGEVLYEMDTTRDRTPLASPSDAVNKFESVFQGDPSDGKTGAGRDDSVVRKQMNPDGGWVYNPADGYYYYTKVLKGRRAAASPGSAAGEPDETTKLLDSVTLSENTDMGFYRERKFYAVTKERPGSESSQWREFATDSNGQYISTAEMNDRLGEQGEAISYMKSAAKLVSPELGGYSSADYTLVVTAQTVQATSQAVNAAFGNGEEFDFKALGCDWELAAEGRPKA